MWMVFVNNSERRSQQYLVIVLNSLWGNYGLTEEVKLTGQMRDHFSGATSSIALNLSEGNAKFSVKEKKRYYKMAYGSIQECKTIFKLISRTDSKLGNKADHLAASLYKLINSKFTATQDSEYC